jgi:DNA-binding beta-propeller fold protein YncE
VIDTKTYAVLETYAIGSGPLGMVITPDGKKVYVANSVTYPLLGENDFAPNTSVSVVDTISKEVKTIEIGAFPTYLSITPDGKKVYVTHRDITVPSHFFSFCDRC